ncbi:S1C family serine protease [Kineothrix sp. MSJ-39]|uniref:S1C family serine protease n=1 Tax=Kineothrix sp. MSJ-39 TaxID=2841533 RepID=UPI0020A13FFC|nr:trypsin-like peptidase domain-containing protein [Kineothrix sp. MSJ-39]
MNQDLTYVERNPEIPMPDDNGKKKHKKEKKPGKGTGRSALNGLVFGLCAALIFCGVVAVGNRTFLKPAQQETVASATADTEETTEAAADKSQTDIPNTTTGTAQTVSQAGTGYSVSDIAKNCMPSIVAITTKGIEEVRSMFGTQQRESEGAGSGIIVGKNDTELLIATNNHVVSGAEEVSVCFDDSEDSVVAAKVKGTDSSNDLAIVSVALSDISDDILSNIKIATIGDSSSVQVGDQVVAIGNALGYGQSVTTGIVSALDREVTIDNVTSKLIQTDAAINPGNSGGALLNMKGELIGINSAKYASAEVEGMGYAIPVATAQPILDNLMTRETREVVSEDEAGYLGVSVQDVSEEASSYYGIPSGAYLAAVEENGAAAKAGIKQGDIITKFDGLSISSASELKSTIAYYKEGETVDVVYMRANNGEYEEHTVSVTLAKSEAAAKQNAQQKNSTDSQNSQSGNPKDGLTVPDPNADESEDQQQDESQYYGKMQDFFDQFFGN